MTVLPPTNAAATRRKPSVSIDTTAMVDLGFLLIMFFLFTSSLSEPKALRLLMPNSNGAETPVAASHSLSLLLRGNGQALLYEGRPEDALPARRFVHTRLQEVGALIRKKQQALGWQKEKLVYLIKPGNDASYKDLVDALDEATINAVARFAVVPPSALEQTFARQ